MLAELPFPPMRRPGDFLRILSAGAFFAQGFLWAQTPAATDATLQAIIE